jgi:hypothetical protein
VYFALLRIEPGLTRLCSSGGQLMGYGLRNDVGISEDPAGNIWAVENAADDLARTIDGQRLDVDDDNPGEPVWNRASYTTSPFLLYEVTLSQLAILLVLPDSLVATHTASSYGILQSSRTSSSLLAIGLSRLLTIL